MDGRYFAEPSMDCVCVCLRPPMVGSGSIMIFSFDVFLKPVTEALASAPDSHLLLGSTPPTWVLRQVIGRATDHYAE